MNKPKAFERKLRDYYEEFKKNPIGFLILAAILLYFGYLSFVYSFGPEKPGALFERSSYERSFYVQVFPDKKSTKNYLLPGDVTKGEGGYTISSITWPNGGYSTFDNCQIDLKSKSGCMIMNSKENEAIIEKMIHNPNYISNNVDELLNLPEYYIQLTTNPV